VAAGAREITLIGQNVNAYRSDGLDFGGLLRRVNAAADGSWIRYITSHPRDCNAAHLSAVAECPNVCENFHLPVQSGSTEVLRRMRRIYSRRKYLDLVERIRSTVPGATLTTDIIVGFPGETEEQFQETLDLVRQVRFDSAYMYMYSNRPGTPAAESYPDHIPLAVKKDRLARLIELQEDISLEINRSLIGRSFRALIEDVAPRTPGDLLARTRGDKMAIVPGPPEWIGRFMDIRIEHANGHTLFAQAVGEAAA
jgi:tRNA-2-methylthio-N6-dimethylallyladenosine synthase